MTFAELMAATALATPDAPVRVRLADGQVAELDGVDIPLHDLDEGKRIGEVPEGHSRAQLVVWLLLAA